MQMRLCLAWRRGKLYKTPKLRALKSGMHFLALYVLNLTSSSMERLLERAKFLFKVGGQQKNAIVTFLDKQMEVISLGSIASKPEIWILQNSRGLRSVAKNASERKCFAEIVLFLRFCWSHFFTMFGRKNFAISRILLGSSSKKLFQIEKKRVEQSNKKLVCKSFRFFRLMLLTFLKTEWIQFIAKRPQQICLKAVCLKLWKLWKTKRACNSFSFLSSLHRPKSNFEKGNDAVCWWRFWFCNA